VQFPVRNDDESRLGFQSWDRPDQEGVKIFASFGVALLQPDIGHVSLDKVFDALPRCRQHRDSGKVETFARRELSGSSLAGETSLVWDVWEQTLQSLSNTVRRRLRLRVIRDLDSYIFSAFAHRLREVLRKERTIEFVPSDRELAELKQTQGWSWVATFENTLELKRAVDEMDDRMKKVLHRWAFDEPWDEISEDMGIITNALKKRFAYYLKKIRSRMLNANTAVSAKG
jgi:hypothetical protein